MAWIGGVTGATAATTAAAAAKRRREEEEEERMTTYSRDELDHDWEFKIVRATFEPFRKPDVLRRLVEEEARAGWVLLEKLDNNRVRFKRPVSARQKDTLLGPDIDPYRTSYNTSADRMVGWMVLLGVLLVGVLVLASIVIVAA